MRIVIDLQGAQSASRSRGIGRYSLALAQAVARNAGEHEIWLVMNGALGDPDQLNSLQTAFSPWLSRARMRVFDPPTPLAEAAPGNAHRARAAELLREYFIEQIKPDAVLVTSLFEGYVDDAVVSTGRFIDGVRTAVVLYDLIPYVNPAAYLPSVAQQQYYAGKIDSLRKAGLLLAISDHARREAIDALGLPEEQVVAISTAVDARFQPGPPATPLQLSQLGLERPFVMYAPGGTDARKNLDGLIAAFAQLPPPLRASHQLLIASAMEDDVRTRLLRSAVKAGLPVGTVVLSGYVDDTALIGLYRSCALFVFPSLHEGFGLPALEAMACGAPVLGANNSSIPEVVGLDEALFDAADPGAIAAAMARALGDQSLLARLREHGRRQASRFSWDNTALRCLRALERRAEAVPAARPQSAQPGARRPRLAFVSPLPPERSGIADYAAQLLPALLPWFEVELVLQQGQVNLTPELAALPRHEAAWFMEHGTQFDQVLYQFGNSPFHGHMFSLLEAHPGVVVLHDFFLSRVLAYEQMSEAAPGAWTDALYHSHGYMGLLAADPARDSELAHDTFPCNLAVLQQATEVIVHSAYSKSLAQRWYGAAATSNWHVVPLPRSAPLRLGRASARAALGIGDDVFLVCSFGFIAPTKLSHLLIETWRASLLGADARCMLVLVGANHGGAYGQQIALMLREQGRGKISIAGWTDDATYHQYLCAADAAVQLRCASRGETSAAVLDCLNYGVPTIVNANGSMAELSPDLVCMLDEDVTAAALRAALEHMYAEPDWRASLGARGRALMAEQHRPAQCAALYAKVLAQAHAAAPRRLPALTAALAATPGLGDADTQQLAAALARLPDPLAQRQLLIDVTTIARNDLRTGIERVVRAQVLALLRVKGPFRTEPVRLSFDDGRWQYRYAHGWTQALLGIEADGAHDHVVDVQPGDVFFGADYAPAGVTQAARAGLYAAWRARGIGVHFQVYDLLPVLQPQFFPPGADRNHAAWLAAIGGAADQLICISGAVASEMTAWLAAHIDPAQAGPRIRALHLGADFDGYVASPATVAPAPRRRMARPTFLMVGTIEPRKGHLQALAAFESLWARGVDVALVVVGGEGWKGLPDSERRTVPQIVDRLTRLQGLSDGRLIWLQGVDDARLEGLYRDSACLLVASEGEGFGLPLIEAARHELPILARDLPVFREVGGAHIHYFDGVDGAALADAILAWHAADTRGECRGAALPWLSWEQHAKELSALLLGTS
jgi:glycosyltransferase involved in cell wall biosynthesis